MYNVDNFLNVIDVSVDTLLKAPEFVLYVRGFWFPVLAGISLIALVLSYLYHKFDYLLYQLMDYIRAKLSIGKKNPEMTKEDWEELRDWRMDEFHHFFFEAVQWSLIIVLLYQVFDLGRFF